MKYWWVNQNQTHEQELQGGYMWSPKVTANNARNQFYDNMTEVVPGDIVFSFYGTRIAALGRVAGLATSAPIPSEFLDIGAPWDPEKEGWYVPVEFVELSQPMRPKDNIATIRPHLPEKYSPLQSSGDGNQGVYLTELPDDLAQTLIELLGPQYAVFLGESDDSSVFDHLDDEAQAAIDDRPDIPETEKLQLSKARRGQGLYKSRLELIETECRVTGVKDRKHLRASHIKPWRYSTDEEKLDGNNGLLLSPHVDHLFDRGFISFTADGDLLVATAMSSDVMKHWGLTDSLNVGAFNRKQSEYLEYHRSDVFKG